MQKKYYVNGIEFKTHTDARKYIGLLKSKETDVKKLNVAKTTPYTYFTQWIDRGHGFFCVCPTCLPKQIIANNRR